MEKIKNYKILFVIIIVILVIFILIYIYTRKDMKDNYIESYNEIKVEDTIEKEFEKEKKEEHIIVHITGAVKNVGIVKLKEGARISDAVDSAGGFTENANITQINLAYAIQDGQKIYIPSINDKPVSGEEQILEKEYVTDEPGDGIIQEDNNENVKSKQSIEKDKININTADETELEKIPGVGETTASKIIEYRKENGKFKNIEDIKNVKGIGEGKFKKMEEKICVK